MLVPPGAARGHKNQALSADALAECLFDSARSRSSATLRGHILELRRALAPEDRVVRSGAGYLISLQPGELDLDQFRVLLGNGQDALGAGDYWRARRLLKGALALWREPALADVPSTHAMRQITDRLDDERRLAAELLSDARLALGQHRELIADLRGRAQSEPTDERAWYQLMLALYRSGRPAEAFAAYARLRTTLAEEYGIDPGPDLQSLHQRMLRGEVGPGPSGSAGPAAGEELPAPVRPGPAAPAPRAPGLVPHALRAVRRLPRAVRYALPVLPVLQVRFRAG